MAAAAAAVIGLGMMMEMFHLNFATVMGIIEDIVMSQAS